MDLTLYLQAIEASALAEWLRVSVRALPVVNALHVIAVGLLFGTILIVDLRLVGLAGTERPFRRTARDLLPYTWTGFVLALATGVAMFAANATTYMQNTAFFVKLGLILLAGLNMLLFELRIARGAAAWDTGPPAPAARLAGALSILMWSGVIVFGRVIGFTKGYDFTIPEDLGDDVDFDFSSLLEAARALVT